MIRFEGFLRLLHHRIQLHLAALILEEHLRYHIGRRLLQLRALFGVLRFLRLGLGLGAALFRFRSRFFLFLFLDLGRFLGRGLLCSLHRSLLLCLRFLDGYGRCFHRYRFLNRSDGRGLLHRRCNWSGLLRLIHNNGGLLGTL